ncbi:MAG: hypothetical protein WCG21_04590 [Eubacteriales bacterium]
MLDTLIYIAEKLNQAGIVWGVGASMLLNIRGITDKPNDIDILVDIKDINKADEILSGIGEKKFKEKTNRYSTKYFYEYVINGVDIDVMSGLQINHIDGVFEYTFDYDSISDIRNVNGVRIPLTSLEDWFVIYQLIPNREAKVAMIENYLISNGVANPEYLLKALEDNLPMEIKDKIEKILKINSDQFNH